MEKIIMKMKRIITALAIAICSALVCSAAVKKTETAIFQTKLHCENCVKKVKENISYVKGVKDLDVSLKEQKITVTFDPEKTNADKLASEIKKLGYPANIINSNEKTPEKCTK